MISPMNEWYVVGQRSEIACLNCGGSLSSHTWADHHPRICPGCGIDMFGFEIMTGRCVQIIPSRAPKPVAEFISWAQDNLDELEFFFLAQDLGAIYTEPISSDKVSEKPD